jgi:multimeric flavodoxin WrbA
LLQQEVDEYENNVIFYSLYGHIYIMAEAAAAGAREVMGQK